jgi:nitroreductase
MIGVVAVTADCQIPVQEQILSAGAAAQNMLNAAHALGLGAMWISPMIGQDAQARAALRLKESDNLIGWLCLGSLKSVLRAKKRPAGARFAQIWLEDGVAIPYVAGDPKAAE